MPEATVYNLFWHVPRPTRELHVALQSPNTVKEPEPTPAVILYPAFLTPAVHVLEGEDRMITLVVAARGEPKLTAALVNRCLRISVGLDALKRASPRPLFQRLRRDDGKDNVVVVDPPIGERKDLEGKIVATASGAFKGILDKRLALPPFLDTLYEVRIHDSCLAPLKPAGRDDPTCQELQDLLLLEVLRELNGPELGGGKPELTPSKWQKPQPWEPQRPRESGLCEFKVSGNRVDLASPDPEHPIVAYHPLFVYPKNGLAWASLGHVSDIHLNARQDVLARSPARVVDMAEDAYQPAGAIESLGADSPAIGSMVNVCSANLLSILQNLAPGLDALLIGGDLIDHVKNVYPWARALKPEDRKKLAQPLARTASEIWTLMDMKDGKAYEKNYQAFVDHLTFFSILRNFCAGHKKPAFVVSGNHDCYKEAFGISPRLIDTKYWKKRANDGIPADTNLTFYEAILAFGRSYAEIKDKSNFKHGLRLLKWFYNVYTPWSDFAVALPKQRIVGLAWGDDEKLLDAPNTGHGLGHLPRANEAVTDEQLKLFKEGLSTTRKSVLFSHFTFVSYAEKISERPPPKAEAPQGPPATGTVNLDTDVPPPAEGAAPASREGAAPASREGAAQASREEAAPASREGAAAGAESAQASREEAAAGAESAPPSTAWTRFKGKVAAAGRAIDGAAEAAGHAIDSGARTVGRGVVSGGRTVGRGVVSGARATANALGIGYTDCDLGTFQNKRAQLYELVADAKRVQAVFTGHSHRKGLYFLAEKKGKSYATELWSLASEVNEETKRDDGKGPILDGKRTPIVVSDSAGPLPRKNVADELWEWGSDRPAGTLVKVGADGRIVSVAPVRSAIPKCKPRLAVAIEYLHVMKKAVLEALETERFRWKKRLETNLFLNLEMKGGFPGWLSVNELVLYARPSVKKHWYGGGTDEQAWIRIGMLRRGQEAGAGRRLFRFAVPEGARGAFCEWLSMPDGSGRFLAMRFEVNDPSPAGEPSQVARRTAQVKEVRAGYDAKSAWTFEADCTTTWGSTTSLDTAYKLSPRLENPLWSWREKFPKYE